MREPDRFPREAVESGRADTKLTVKRPVSPVWQGISPGKKPE